MGATRVVFLDVDGTLIDHAGRMGTRTVDAIRRARANGHLVLLSTGRVQRELPHAVRSIKFDGAITAAGAFAQVGDTLVTNRTMTAHALHRATSLLTRIGHEFVLQLLDSVWATQGARSRLFAGLEGGDVPESVVLDTTAGNPMPTSGVAKIVFLGENADAYNVVARALSHEYHVITGTIPHLGQGAGEIAPLGVTKGAAVISVLAHLGVSAERSIGIGDNVNDIEMFAACGVGIAMGNAASEIRTIADEVTSSVLDDGIWVAFERHGLL